ncbi:MAG: hypothetical protein ACPLPS_00020 [bacterium]
MKEKRIWKVADDVYHCKWDRHDVLWFDRKRGNNWSIWQWRPGFHRPLLVIDKAMNPFPSPDGQWVVCFPYVEIKDEISLKKSSALILLHRHKKIKKIPLVGPPLFCNWSPRGDKLFTICLPGLSTPSVFTFHILMLIPPSFEQTVVSVDSYPIAWDGSWCIEDGGFVFVTREGFPPKNTPKNNKVPLSFPGERTSPSLFYFWKYNTKGGGKKLTLLWKERGYGRSFAISPDGRFLIIPHTALGEKNKVYHYLNLADLNNKKESKIKRGEFKQGIGRVWWHRGLRGFCIVAFNKILLLKETSEVETLLSLEELD